MAKEKDIFDKALECFDSKAREECLTEECGSNIELRNRVDDMLERYEGTAEFVFDGEEFHEQTAHDIEIGSKIGPYRIMEQIGRGGMGVVYVADQQTPVRRRVALKVIKPGMDSREILHRFQAERQALALMEHPNIARVLDAGETHTGRPYFVMELVRGVPITQYCDEKTMSSRDRLVLFQSVCSAVQHAHQKGIIHRDIKPGNVLVTAHDDKAVVKVIDFGVAKAINQTLTEGTIYTKITQIIGTPLYMSPEQAEMSGLDIDTRSDIYSLGVLLYELLTGSTPFDRRRLRDAAFDEMRRIIREEEPLKPSTKISDLGQTAESASKQRGTNNRHLSQMLRGDLDWIVMKTLEKDRTRRYETANGLAQDVQRFLDAEPVIAGPPSSIYRFKKFIQRNRAGAIAAGLVLSSLILGVIGTSLGMASAIRAWNRAELAAEKSDSSADAERIARKDAEREARSAREAVQKMLTAVGDQRLRNVPMMDGLRAQLLEEALLFNQQFLADSGSNDDKFEAGQAYLRVAKIYSMMERNEEALNSLKQADQIYLALKQSDPANLDHAFWMGETKQRIAAELMAADELDEAEQFTRRCLNDFQSITANSEAQTRFLVGIAVGQRMLAAIMDQSGRNENAEQLFTDSLATFGKLDSQAIDTPQVRFEMAVAHMGLGSLLELTQRGIEADKHFNEALRLNQQLVDDDPNDRAYRESLAANMDRVAWNSRRHGDHERARNGFKDAIKVYVQLATDFPQIPDYRSDLASCMSRLAIVFADHGDMKTSATEFQNAYQTLKELHEDFPDVVDFQFSYAKMCRMVGAHHINMGRLEDAIGVLNEGYEQIDQIRKHNPEITRYQLDCSETCFLLAVTTQRIDRTDPQVARWVTRSLGIAEPLSRKLPNETEVHHKLAKYYRLLASINVDQEKFDEAEEQFRNAIAVQRTLVRNDPTAEELPRHLAISIHELGRFLLDQERYEAAENATREAIGIRQKNLIRFPGRKDHAFELAMGEILLGRILVKRQDFVGAANVFQNSIDRCRDLSKQSLGVAGHRHLFAMSLEEQTRLYFESRQKTKIEENVIVAETQLKRELARDDADSNSIQGFLYVLGIGARSLVRQGEFDAAEAKLKGMSSRLTSLGRSNYIAAESAAQCIPIVMAFEFPDEAKRLETKSRFSTLAVSFLREALENGLEDEEDLGEDESFASLAEDSAFKELINSIGSPK